MRASVLLFACILAAGSILRAGETLSPEQTLPGHGDACAYAPAAAFGKDIFLVVWRSDRHEKADLVAARIDRSGKALDAEPFVVSGAGDEQSRPRVAFGGGVFLVVWQDLRSGKDYDVYAARVTGEGKVLDADGIPVAAAKDNQCQPAVGFDGKTFQVLWRHFPGKDGYDIHGGRVSIDGRPLDGAGALLVKTPDRVSDVGMGPPGILSSKDGAILAGADAAHFVHFWRMKDGKLAGRLAAPPGGRSPWRMTCEPVFATDGKNVLVVFTTWLNTGGRSSGCRNSGIAILEAGLDLKKTATKSLSKAPAKGWVHVRHPSPAWDGKGYVVAWDIHKRAVIGRTQGHLYDVVLMRRVSAAGEPQGEDILVAGEPDSPAFRPAVVSDGKGSTLVAYERHPKTAEVPIRIGFRVLK